jgi:hypothetical protein
VRASATRRRCRADRTSRVRYADARVVSFIVAISQGSYAFAPAAFGAVRALSASTPQVPAGDATLVFAMAAFIQGLATCCFLLGRRH